MRGRGFARCDGVFLVRWLPALHQRDPRRQRPRGVSATRRLARRLLRDRLLLLSVAVLTAALAAALAGGGDGGSGRGPGGVLLIADLRGHSLVVLDLERPRERRRIPLPGGPHELLRLDDGRVVASLEQRGALAIVDVHDGAVETLAVGGLPHGLAAHDGLLYVTDRSAGVVRRLRVEGWRELTPLAAGLWPHAVAALPDGEAVVASAGDDTLRIGQRALTVSALPEAVALAPDGRRVPVPGVPDGLSFDGSGRYLFASDLAGGVVSVIDVARGRVSQQFASGESAGALLALAY